MNVSVRFLRPCDLACCCSDQVALFYYLCLYLIVRLWGINIEHGKCAKKSRTETRMNDKNFWRVHDCGSYYIQYNYKIYLNPSFVNFVVGAW